MEWVSVDVSFWYASLNTEHNGNGIEINFLVIYCWFPCSFSLHRQMITKTAGLLFVFIEVLFEFCVWCTFFVHSFIRSFVNGYAIHLIQSNVSFIPMFFFFSLSLVGLVKVNIYTRRKYTVRYCFCTMSNRHYRNNNNNETKNTFRKVKTFITILWLCAVICHVFDDTSHSNIHSMHTTEKHRKYSWWK